MQGSVSSVRVLGNRDRSAASVNRMVVWTGVSPKAASVAGGVCHKVPLSHQVPHRQATQNLVSGSEDCGKGTGFQVDPDGQVPAWHTPLPVVCLLRQPRSRVSGRCLGQAPHGRCQLGLTLGNSCSWSLLTPTRLQPEPQWWPFSSGQCPRLSRGPGAQASPSHRQTQHFLPRLWNPLVP